MRQSNCMTKLNKAAEFISLITPFILTFLNWYTSNTVAAVIATTFSGIIAFCTVLYCIYYHFKSNSYIRIKEIQKVYDDASGQKDKLIEYYQNMCIQSNTKAIKTKSKPTNPME